MMTTKVRKERISVQLDPNDVLVLQILADETQVSVSAIVRQLVGAAMPYLRRSADLAAKLRDANEDARDEAAKFGLSVGPLVNESLGSADRQVSSLFEGFEERLS